MRRRTEFGSIAAIFFAYAFCAPDASAQSTFGACELASLNSYSNCRSSILKLRNRSDGACRLQYSKGIENCSGASNRYNCEVKVRDADEACIDGYLSRSRSAEKKCTSLYEKKMGECHVAFPRVPNPYSTSGSGRSQSGDHAAE